jgi:hypothetical protein
MCTVADLGNEIAELAARLDAATHRLLECIRQFDESNEWAAQGAVSCAHWLCWRIGLDPGTAREKVRVARALGQLPKLDEALRLGKLSYAKVRVLTRVVSSVNEAALLELALVATGAQLERICRGYRAAKDQDRPCQPEDRSVRRRFLPAGMVKLEIVLSPDEADLVMRAVDCARDVSAEARKPESDTNADWPSQPDGVVALAESFLAGNRATGTGGDRYQVVLHVDQDPLAADGTLATTLDDGARVPAETFRRVACDCGLLAVTGDPGTGMNVGRRTRSIPPAIRRALQLRDHGCAFPGCPHTRFLHGHHVRHWLHCSPLCGTGFRTRGCSRKRAQDVQQLASSPQESGSHRNRRASRRCTRTYFAIHGIRGPCSSRCPCFTRNQRYLSTIFAALRLGGLGKCSCARQVLFVDFSGRGAHFT